MTPKILITGAGYGSQVQVHAGEEVDGHPMWISRFILTNQDALRRTFLDYLDAGCDLLNTLTYQASVPGFMKCFGVDEAKAYDLLKESVRIVRRTIDEYMKSHPERQRPLICGGCGSFGACLNDGSEYTGAFVDKVNMGDVLEWHRPRIRALIEEGADFIAFETIPALAEAKAVLSLMKEFPGVKAWVSFQCKDTEHTAYGDNFKEAVRECWALNPEQLLAVGCNCVNPEFVAPLFDGINPSPTDIKYPLVVYPNSGEEFSHEKGWHGRDKWDNFDEKVFKWLDQGVRYLGSCCRTDVNFIRKNKAAVQKWLEQRGHK